MTPYVSDVDFTLWNGDVRHVLPTLEAGSVDCCVTSPPYWGLRDYGTGQWDGGDLDCDHVAGRGGYLAESAASTRGGAGKSAEAQTVPFRDVCGKCGAARVDRQLGLERTPDEYVAALVAVFREVRRVLTPSATVWLNLGDSYVSVPGSQAQGAKGQMADRSVVRARAQVRDGKAAAEMGAPRRPPSVHGLKPKDLVGIPWRVAFALQADGWYLRSDIIWAKSNPMPESVTDRPTKSHEYVFLLSRSPRYFFDQEAAREPAEWARWGDQTNDKHEGAGGSAGWIGSRPKGDLTQRRTAHYNTAERYGAGNGGNGGFDGLAAKMRSGEHGGRNVRSVWEIATQPYPEAHFATYPEELVRRCIAAGCPEWVCGTCGKPRGAEVVRSPLASGPVNDPTMLTGRKGMNRERREGEGTRAITKSEQRDYAGQLRDSPFREAMEAEAGEAFAHYIRTDDSGARPVPAPLLNVWLDRGWLTAAEASDCGHGDYRPGTVLDPFAGSGTTALVARRLGRRSVGVELNQAYCALAARRLGQQSLLAEGAA